MAIATVTADLEGERVEDREEVGRPDLASLLGSTFDDEDVSVVVHEVHAEEWIEDLKARYPHRWDARVEVDE